MKGLLVDTLSVNQANGQRVLALHICRRAAKCSQALWFDNKALSMEGWPVGNQFLGFNQVGLLHAHTGAAGAGLPPLLLLPLLC